MDANRTKKLKNLGLIGAGNMGGALMRGVAERRLMDADSLWIYDVDSAKAESLADDLCAPLAGSNADLLARCNTVIIAVKPPAMADLLEEIAPHVKSRHLFISIAAGIPIRWMQSRLGAKARIVRVMPNMPALVGCCASAVARGPEATDADMRQTMTLFEAVGVAVEVDEAHINAVTGLSGSGPAYVFRMIEAMTQAGEKAGLAPDVAAALTRQTVLGAARMVTETGDDPAELRRRVTSPNGTTEAGLKILDAGGFMDLIEKTVARATERGEELGKMYD